MKTGKRGALPRLALALLAVWAFCGCGANAPRLYLEYEGDPYVFSGEYKMIRVPVPEGGVTLLVGVNDEETARVEEAFYIGETLVTQALYDTVARWAVSEKEVGKYYGLIGDHHSYEHNYIDDAGIMNYRGGDLPVKEHFGAGVNGFGATLEISETYVSPVWCNAYTQWHNEKYGTNYTPVYLDEHGNPKRTIDNYGYVRAARGRTGFRLPTQEEWELAARWQGTDTVNAVTGTINGTDFSAYPLKFTKGNSASGARDSVANLNECSRVALFEYNHLLRPAIGKTRAPNGLGIYDMSGNIAEFVITFWTDSVDAVRGSRGGHYLSAPEELAVGKRGSVNGNGLRLVRNAE